ncbi:MAG TPA: beta-galactosidase [Allosphingosinicella sp.]|nr:beta-galactosidase [Allosphingosinicella sp.]
MKLGVCYYPEQWPESLWVDDARRMRAMGLSRVRIGEFAWLRLEPEPGRFDWVWLDRAIAILHEAGLDVVLGTPTATPPKWLVDAKPDILAWDEGGRPRRFGSRRHYCFSSAAYRKEAARICSAVCERYGRHPAVVAWQTDNEYGCHDTILSYSPGAAVAFRRWLAARYTSVDALNAAWGNAFWSQEYRSFGEVDPPNLTVTEANPAHRLDYQRFASDEVVSFNRMQTQIIRRHSPGRDLVHNFMGFFTGFDHFAVAADLDVATWDSYPLGFLDQGWDDAATKLLYLRQGHPDFAAFHHDLYRGCGRGRMWVLEQQPGPVNWAPNNPAPLPGMVRLWTLEACAHGAELVSYFRWRQAPFGQEQMHAGLLRPDNSDGPAAAEVAAVAAELRRLPDAKPRPAPVALLFSYEAQWMLGIQPQGEAFGPLRLAFEFYTAVRALGLDVDILPPDADLTGYQLVIAPSLPVIDDKLAAGPAHMLFGPRSGSKTREFQIPADLPPGPLQQRLPLRVTAVESLRPGYSETVPGSGGSVINWLEHVETALAPRLSTAGGRGLWYQSGRTHYLAGWPNAALLLEIVAALADECGLAVRPLPEGLRLRRHGDVQFAFNYAPHEVDLGDLVPEGTTLLLGSRKLPAAGVAAWPAD